MWVAYPLAGHPPILAVFGYRIIFKLACNPLLVKCLAGTRFIYRPKISMSISSLTRTDCELRAIAKAITGYKTARRFSLRGLARAVAVARRRGENLNTQIPCSATKDEYDTASTARSVTGRVRHSPGWRSTRGSTRDPGAAAPVVRRSAARIIAADSG